MSAQELEARGISVSALNVGDWKTEGGKLFRFDGKEWIGVIEGDGRIADQRWDRPEHYGGEDNPFEPIKIIEHYDLNFNLGCVIKYVLRAPFKGTALKDLKKAYTYIGFEIRRRERAGETE